MDITAEIDLLDTRLLASISTAFPSPLNDGEKIVANAFLVLGHACVEEHIEESFMGHAKRLATALGDHAPPSDAARAALAFGLSATEKLRKAHPYDKRDLRGFVEAAVTAYEVTVVAQNHGVKSSNIKKLAEGIGVPWAEFDAAMAAHLADLDNLGARRGEAGHLAPLTMKATKITKNVDPEDVRKWVHAGRDAALAIRDELARRVDLQVESQRLLVSGPKPFRTR